MGKAIAAAGLKPKASKSKIKITKQQKIRVHQMISLENRISVCRDYIRLWMKFFELFADDIYKRQITEQEEKVFFQTITTLARKHFLFCELMSDTFDGGEKILDVLVTSVALSNIKAMNENSLSKLELDWHQIFLDMNVGLGRLLRQLPPGVKIDDALARADAMIQSEGGTAPRPAQPEKKSGFFSRLFGSGK